MRYRKALKPLARGLRNHPTDAEQKLWRRIRRKQLEGVQFFRQRPIASYIVDFYAGSVKVAIELDGSQHFEKEHQLQDHMRDQQLQNLGITVLRFSNSEVFQNLEGVLQEILRVLKKRLNPPIPPFEGKGGLQEHETTTVVQAEEKETC